MHSKIKKYIFILGTGRSGSTVLDLMIGKSSQYQSLGEISAYYYPYRVHHKVKICSCNKKKCKLLRHFENKEIKDLFVNISNNKIGYIDSSKNLAWNYLITKKLKTNGINSIYNLFIIKSFKEYAYSIYKRGESMNNAFKKYINYHNKILYYNIPYILIKQKDILNKTTKFINIIKEKLDIEFTVNNFNIQDYNECHFFGSPSIESQHLKVPESNNEIIRNRDEFEKDYNDWCTAKHRKIILCMYKNLLARKYSKITIHKFRKTINLKFKIWYFFKKIKMEINKFRINYG